MSNRTTTSGEISFDNIRDTVANFDNHTTSRTNANANNNPDGITIGSGTGVALNEYVMYRDQRGLQRQNMAPASNNTWNFLDLDFSYLDLSGVDFSNISLDIAVYPNNDGTDNYAEKANTKPLGPFGFHQSGVQMQPSAPTLYLDPNLSWNTSNTPAAYGNVQYFGPIWSKYGQSWAEGQKISDYYNMGNRKSFNITVGHEANIRGDDRMSNANHRNNHVDTINGISANIPSFVGRRVAANTLSGSNAYNNWRSNHQAGASLHFGSTGSGSMGNITTPDGYNWPIAAVGFVPIQDHTGFGSATGNFRPIFCLFVFGNFVEELGTRQAGWGVNSHTTSKYWRNNYQQNTTQLQRATRYWKSDGYTTGGRTYYGLFKGIKINLGSGARKYHKPNSNDPTFNIRGQLSHQSKSYGNNGVGADHVFLIGDNQRLNSNSITQQWGEYPHGDTSYAPKFKGSDHGISTNISSTWETHGSSWAGPNKVAQNRYYTYHDTLGHPDYTRFLWDIPRTMYDEAWFESNYGNDADITNNEQQWAYIKHVWQSGKTINVEILEH